MKAALYAREGIPEYWLVNLLDRVVEVQRQPAPMAGQPLGHGYRSITHYATEEAFAPLAAPPAAPPATITAADLLP